MVSTLLKKALLSVIGSLAVLSLFVAPLQSTSADSGTGGAPADLISPATLPPTYVGTYTEWSLTLSASAPTTVSHPLWQITSGALPAGMTLQQPAPGSRTAKIVGTPTFSDAGTSPVEFQVVTNMSLSDPKKTYAFMIRPMEVGTLILQDARAGSAYAETLLVSGGTAPHQWSVTTGSLPQGLSLSSAGVLSGTPTYASGTTFVVTVNDGAGRTASRQLTLAVNPDQVLAVSTLSVPAGSVGQGYSTNFAAVGGTAPYRWDVLSGTLPTGTALDAAGRLSGTFSAAGSYTFVVRVTDALSRVATKSFSVNVSGSSTAPGLAPTIGSAWMPVGTVGAWYGYNLGVTGGVAPYAWTLVSGSLPPGLMFEAGSLYGTPTRAGTYAFTVKVADAALATGVRDVTVTINAAAITGSTGAGTGAGVGMTGTGSTSSVDTEVRVRNLDRIGIAINSLVKLPDDGRASTQEDSAVYFIGNDGRRHAFPNANVFFTWYTDFNGVRVVSSADLASIPLGRNATYRPGIKMVKFTTDARVYAVSTGRTLRPIASEQAARDQYGASWNRKIDDIADTFYTDYQFGSEIRVLEDFNPVAVREAVATISDTLSP